LSIELDEADEILETPIRQILEDWHEADEEDEEYPVEIVGLAGKAKKPIEVEFTQEFVEDFEVSISPDDDDNDDDE